MPVSCIVSGIALHLGVESPRCPSGRVLPPRLLSTCSASGIGVALALFDHRILRGHQVPLWADSKRDRIAIGGDWRGCALRGQGCLQMVRIAASMTDALVLRKAVLEKESIWHGFDPCFIEDPVGLDLPIVGVHPAIPVLVPGSFELPTASYRQNIHQAEQVLASEVHTTNFTRGKWASQELVIRFGHFGVSFGVSGNWYRVHFGATRCNFPQKSTPPANQDKASPVNLLY